MPSKSVAAARKDGHQAAEDMSNMSVIGADITINGDIEASVDLLIEGKVHGDVRCATLILGEKSSVSGSIFAERVRVGGAVEGTVETRDLAIDATARIGGDIVYERLRVASGGIIEGSMKRPAQQTVEEPKRESHERDEHDASKVMIFEDDTLRRPARKPNGQMVD
ncbi:MAG: polymer-forming cytoskeletal protein [Sphingomonadaceae bacterium]